MIIDLIGIVTQGLLETSNWPLFDSILTHAWIKGKSWVFFGDTCPILVSKLQFLCNEGVRCFIQSLKSIKSLFIMSWTIVTILCVMQFIWMSRKWFRTGHMWPSILLSVVSVMEGEDRIKFTWCQLKSGFLFQKRIKI